MADVPILDRTIYPVLVALRDCLDAELERSQGGRTASTDIIWSADIDGDFCDCSNSRGRGRAWVKYTEDNDNDRCPAPLLTLHIGVFRCLPYSEVGKAATMVLAEAVTIGLSDRAAIRRAVNCCKIRNGKIIRNEAWGPEGGCYGNITTIEAQIC